MLTYGTEKRNEAIVVSGIIDVKNKFLRKIVNKIYNRLEYKRHYKIIRLLRPFMFHRKINGNKPICFVIWAWYANDVNAFYGKYLRKKYPGCKLVCRFEDIIEKMPYKNIDEYMGSFDLLQTFDMRDAEKYNIDYYPSWYDSYDIEDIDMEESDVLFVGRGKDRMAEIIDVFERLDAAGLNCKFYLVDVPPEQRKYENKITYCDYIPYSKVICMVKKTRCILEIMQKDGAGETLRAYEAITYNKKLITNNIHVLNRDYYSPDRIHVYSDVDSLDPGFVYAQPELVIYDDIYAEKLHPINMLNDIGSKITR